MSKSKFENELCYYAWDINFNTDSFEKINVLGHSYIQKWLREYLSKEYNKFEDFVKELDTVLRCHYSGDRNYEFMAKDLFDTAKEYKVNVYDQLKLNIPIIAKYILDTWNLHKRKVNQIKENKTIDKVPLIDIGSHYDDEEGIEIITIDDYEVDFDNEEIVKELAYHIKEIEEKFNKLLEDIYGD